MGFFTPTKPGFQENKRASASRLNELERQVQNLSAMLIANGLYTPGTGPVTRRVPGGGGTKIVFLEAQEDAPADTVIECKKATYNGATWSTEGDTIEVPILVTNTAVGSNYNAVIPRIVTGDILPAFYKFGEYWFTTVFQPTVDCDCYEAP